MLYVFAYIAAIPAANWLIGNAGTVCVPNGPCLIPVWPGVMAPSGVLMIGVALVLRDLVQMRYGAAVSAACVVAGAGLSAFISPPSLALASGAAFLLSELADLLVYTPLAKRRLILAVVLSGVVGAIVDSLVFLMIAFGSLDYLLGQVIGKLWAIVFAVPILMLIRRRHHVRQEQNRIG